MSKGNITKRILNKNNKGLGLFIVLSSLAMIFSLILLPYKCNPLFLMASVTSILFIGYSGTLAFWILELIFALWYYLNTDIKWFSEERTIMLITAIISVMTIAGLIIIAGRLTNPIGEILEFKQYYHIVAIEPVTEFWNNISWTQRLSLSENLINLGIILPMLLWLIGGWWYGVLTIIILIILLLYSIYVLIANDYVILLSRLAFWSSDKDSLDTNVKAEGLDLNLPTEEFELNFEKVQVSKDKLELIEKVRQNMDTKDYKELSEKIASEKNKLIELRKKVIAKIKGSKEAHQQQSSVSNEQRQEIMASLGYSTYSSVKSSIERSQETAQSKEPFRYTKPETYVEEEKVEENVALANEGYKTTEEAYNIKEPSLADAFAEDMLESFDPTQELPIIENYEEIFGKEDELVQEINKTLETIVNLEEEINESKPETGEVVIENLDEEVTVEDYLSIPETIAATQEQQLDLEQNIVIEEQKSDETSNSEFSSIQEEKTSEEAIQLIEEETPSAIIEEEPQVEVVDKNTSTEEESTSYDFLPEEDEEEDEEESKKRPTDWCKPYVLPSTSILSSNPTSFDNGKLVDEATEKAKKLNITFESFGVKAEVNSFEIGPTVTTFKVTLQPGIKTTKVTNLEDNIKLTLGAEYIRIIAPIPGTSFIGIEVPNSTKRPVLFKTVCDETPLSNEGIIISIGQDVAGKSLSFDLTKAPHLLVAGSTGSGKSVAINTILASILLRYKPTDVQLILVDPKMVEFAPFHGVPHLLAEVITDASNANLALQAMVNEMEERYKKMASMGAKKIEELNEKLIAQGENKLPYIVVVIDELADLMMVAAKDVEDSIMRITQKARAAGIHMILATQRPSTEIITGTIKSNIPSRMAFTVASSIDSRTILGQVGAEKLIGMGDMLVSLYGQLPFRGQGAYISNEEVEDITAFTKSQCDAHYEIDVESLVDMSSAPGSALISTSDPIYIAAKDTVMHYQKASTSMLQRHLNIGYNKAANIIETLEAEGIIGPAKGSKPREVLKA